MNTDLVRYQKSSTISVLKFNRMSQNNCNVSQTESEISLNSIKKESKNKGNQNSQQSFRNMDTSQTYFKRTNTYFNNTEQDDQRIDEFNEFSGRQFNYIQDNPQPNSRKFELNLVNQAIKIPSIDGQNTSKLEENTTKRQRSKWADDQSQQSPSLSQKLPFKILNQSEMKNSTDRFGILMENMNKSLLELKLFRNLIEKQEQEEQLQKQIPKQEIKTVQEKKPIVSVQKTQTNYFLPKQKSTVLKQEQPKQSTCVQQRNKSRAKSQNGIIVELREQVNAQFNRTPERQPNYKSITPVRQIIKCVELNDNRNDKLFSVQYRLRTGKQINVTMRRHDNLIKVAQDAAQKHKLQQNGYLQLLKILKDKYRTILENQRE